MDPAKLARLLAPETIAVVGASEKLGMSNNAVLPMLDAGIDVRLVNPNRDSVYGRPTAPSLTALDEPIDAVLSLVSAERSIGVVAEAAAAGCGGVVVAAGGFGELGDEGKALQARLVDAASDGLAIVGPNCSGFMNVARRVNLFTGGRIALEPGPVAVVSQSGFLLRSVLAAGQQRQLGFGVAVSSGNEAVCGLHDYIDLLAGDRDTRVICVVVEKVWSSDAFFAAVHRARSLGKALIVLKLGRTERSRKIMQSHTGAIADESWVYDIVLRQAGVLTANDIDEMLDRAQLLAQLPAKLWHPIDGVAVMASSGGVAGVAADAADTSGVALPTLVDLEPWVRERVPGDGSVNPLDMTGFVMRDPELMQELFAGYAGADGVDALVLCWWAGEGDEAWSRTLLEPLAKAATEVSVPLIVTPVEGTAIGAWTREFRERGLTFCRGLASTYRALRAVDEVARAEPPMHQAGARPDAGEPPELVTTDAGAIVPFGTAMHLLAQAGLPVVPYVLLEPGQHDDTAARQLGDRLVVKLADAPHRTEIDAVRVDVTHADLAAAVLELRAIARAHDLPETVVVQPLVGGHGEAFIGLQARSDLGAVVLFGRGGVLVELAPRVGGRRLPLAPGAAGRLVTEVVGAGTFEGLRGAKPWATAPLVAAVEAVAQLWQHTGAWLASVDLNPVIVTDDGVAVVDALLVAAPPDGR